MLIFAVVCLGVLGHSSHYPIAIYEERYPHLKRLFLVVRYVIGLSLVLLAQWIIYASYPNLGVSGSGLAAAAGVGSGVVLSHLWDYFRGN
jgi:hypothetical protein